MTKKRIVLIEDDDDTRDAMVAALEAEGYLVQASADAFGDIRHARADLVILDLFLHGEAAGWQQLDVLTLDPATRAIPVIVCSAAIASLGEARTKLAMLDVAVLEKPFDLEQLSAAVAAALTSGRRQAELPLRG
ncbi:MAG TPA: response regulator [Candidatus Saccharimonadales bacterium]|nr:response regulator [Candidatus Saccharimonadales bacterium]